MNIEWKLMIRRIIFHPVDSFSRVKRFTEDIIQFGRMNRRETFAPLWSKTWPFFFDWSASAGTLSYYFWQDLWAAKKIFERQPSSHFDVGSRIDGFVAHLLAFMPVTLIDIRPLPYMIDGLSFICANATEMSKIESHSLESLSSLCALEHFGLGRYGDPIDPEACFKAMEELQRVLAVGGRLYIAVPIGVERIYFNAHRTFATSTILGAFSSLQLIDFAVIDTRSSREIRYLEHADLGAFDAECNDDGALIGLFEFTKTKAERS